METVSSADNNDMIRELRQRIRQLDCIHAIFNIVVNLNNPFDQIIQDITETVPLGFNNPKRLCSCLTVENKVAMTANFKRSPWTIKAGITLNGKNAGILEVGYPEPIPSMDSCFVDEEKKFIQIIADRIGVVLECKIMKDTLEESERRHREFLENAPVGVYRTNLKGDILYANDICLRIFGFNSIEEARAGGGSPLYYKNPEKRKTILNILNQTGKLDNFELEMITKTGQPIVLLLNATLCSDTISGMMTDITKRKYAERSLEKAFEEIKKLKDQLEAENIYLRDEMELKGNTRDIIGVSDPIKYVMYRVRQVARTKTTVFLTGETGVGKGIFARFLHRESDRGHKPIVQVNCAGLPANLIESELFGREKGAFTGSTARQIGRFEIADKSTIFLDEIGELPIELQAKLLKVIEDGEFERLGSPHTVKVDVRIIASTNRNLEEEIKRGRFRKDLFFRLSVFPIPPPSSQTKER